MKRIPITIETLIQYGYIEEFNFPIAVGIGKRKVVKSTRVFINSVFGEKVIYEIKNNIEIFRTDWANFSRVQYMDEIIKWYLYMNKKDLPDYIKIGFMKHDPFCQPIVEGSYYYPYYKALEAGFKHRIMKVDNNAKENTFVYNGNEICIGFKGNRDRLYESDNHPNSGYVIAATEDEFNAAMFNEELNMFLVKN
jgi:hypothetical protein